MGQTVPSAGGDTAANPPLDDEARTNGTASLVALKPLSVGIQACAVAVLRADGSPAIQGVQVSSDGYFLTKASEVPEGELLNVRWSDGKVCKARRVREDLALDLLLAKADTMQGMAAPWDSSTHLTGGVWVTAGTLESPVGGVPLRLGVVSATRRPIPPGGAGMGIRMRDDLQLKAVRIIELSAEGPARAAGLKEGDLVVAVGDEPINSADRLQSILRRHQPGDEVRVAFRRGEQPRQCRVRLASLTQVVSNFDGEDYGNGGVSIRTDGFPMVLQHAMPLSPSDMGGALFDLDGNAVGINIARADRVTTFALPTEVFWARTQEWIQKDRAAAPGE